MEAMNRKLLVLLGATLLGGCFGDDDKSGRTHAVQVTFLGTSTLLIDDGVTRLMTDGFFSHPPLSAIDRIEPDVDVIHAQLAAIDVDELAAVIVVHSHHDHVMDAPEVARVTGAQLLGSASTANVGRGWGLAEHKITEISTYLPYRFGDFSVTFIPSRHVEGGLIDDAGATIDEPVMPPLSMFDYKEGGTFSILIEHPATSLLIHASTNYEPNALMGYQADTVFLGLGLFNTLTTPQRENYLTQVVDMVGARRIVPIHWDNLFAPLQSPLQRDASVAGSIDYLRQQAEARGLDDIQLLDFREAIMLAAP